MDDPIQFYVSGDQCLLTHKENGKALFVIKWRFVSGYDYELDIAEIATFDDFYLFCTQTVRPPDFVVYSGSCSNWRSVFHRFVTITTMQFNSGSF